jgi:hypothetical protein
VVRTWGGRDMRCRLWAPGTHGGQARAARNCVHAAWDRAALLATCYGMLQAQASMCGRLLGGPLHAGATCPDQIAPKAGTQLRTCLAAGTAAAGAQQSCRACTQ